MKTSILILSFLSLSLVASSQSQPEKLVQKVLKENIPRRNFEFNMKDKQQTEYSIKYLGSVTVKNGNTYKIVNYQTYSKPVGLMQHANCILLIYTGKNKFAGAYFVGDDLSLTDYLDNKELVFVGKVKCKEMTRVSLANGLPQQIYKKCTKKLGDMFEYSTMYPF